jgi:two-component system chemotaxis response regulator CheY
MRILLVEDTDSLRYLFALMLKQQGYEVCEARDGLEALGCLVHFHPELILTDLRMPGLDGIGLIRRLRAMPELDDVPVVAMTSLASSEAEREARRAGAACVLAKPIDSGTLLACLACYG